MGRASQFVPGGLSRLNYSVWASLLLSKITNESVNLPDSFLGQQEDWQGFLIPRGFGCSSCTEQDAQVLLRSLGG